MACSIYTEKVLSIVYWAYVDLSFNSVDTESMAFGNYVIIRPDTTLCLCYKNFDIYVYVCVCVCV